MEYLKKPWFFRHVFINQQEIIKEYLKIEEILPLTIVTCLLLSRRFFNSNMKKVFSFIYLSICFYLFNYFV